jgi:hypothetical protein
MQGKRDRLLKKITEESNLPYMEKGLALYNKLHSFLDDMKLEHQERRIMYQSKLNGTQHDFIKSQMTGFFNPLSSQTITQDFFPRERTASIENYRNYSPLGTDRYNRRNLQLEGLERKTLTPPPVMRRSPSHSPEFKSFQKPQLTDRNNRKNTFTTNPVKPTPPITRPKSHKTFKKVPPKSSGNNPNGGYFMREKFIAERFKPFEPQNKPPKAKRPGRKQNSIEGRKSRTPLEAHSNNLEKDSPTHYRGEFDGSMELIGPPINYNNLISKISLGNNSKAMNYRSASDTSEINYSSNEIRQKLPQIGQKKP